MQDIPLARLRDLLLDLFGLSISVRRGRANWWLWVFHHGGSAVFAAAARRSRAVVAAFLGDHRPALWTSDRFGAQAGWATKGHQACLAHLIRSEQTDL